MADHYGLSKSNEWYTPARYLRAVHSLLGGVDVDPASCTAANRTVRASAYFTKESDGFSKPWPGRVFLNPPYGKHSGNVSNQQRWAWRLIEQYEAGITTEAVLLVTAATSERWFQPLWNYPICFTAHRIAFVNEHGEKVRGNTKGGAFVYMGPQGERFCELFAEFGPVVVRAGTWQPVLSAA